MITWQPTFPNARINAMAGTERIGVVIPAGDGQRYSWRFDLPQQAEFGVCRSDHSARNALENAFAAWLSRAGLGGPLERAEEVQCPSA